jgi:tetratricopeptide (TPR) repeat protein
MLSTRLLGADVTEASTRQNLVKRSQGSFLETERLFSRITSTFLNGDDRRRRLVVLVDDLDRCRRSRAVEVLEAMRVFFSFPGLVFVVAVNREEIELAITDTYEGMTLPRAGVYLEKVFQLGFPLPGKGLDELIQFIDLSLAELDIRVEDPALKRTVVDRFGRNLRNLKVFMNGFSFRRDLLGDEAGQLGDEMLLKWLFLDFAAPQTMASSIAKGTPDYLLAMEFLSRNCCLGQPDIADAYRARLGTHFGGALSAVVHSTLPDLPDGLERLDEIEQVTPPQFSELERDLRADGDVVSTLRVLGEGDEWLIDTNLSYLSLLATITQDLDLRVVAESEARSEESEVKANDSTTQLDEKLWIWNRVGDQLRRQGHLIQAHLAYLVAVTLRPEDPIHWTDLARSFRIASRYDAARAAFRTAVTAGPDSTYTIVELSYFFEIALHDDASAEIAYRRALALGSKLGSIPGNLSNVYARMDLLPEVLDAAALAVLREDTDSTKLNNFREALAANDESAPEADSDLVAVAQEVVDRAIEQQHRMFVDPGAAAVSAMMADFPTLSDAAADFVGLPFVGQRGP